MIFHILKLAIVILLLSVSYARAHDWYPKHCCHGKDCAAAQVIKHHKKGGVTLRHSKLNTQHFVWYSEIKPSPDGNWHLCVDTNPENDSYGMVLCVFAPGAV